MTADAARHKEELFATIDRAKGGVFAARPVHRYWVPGRIEVLGKHTDYAGGRSLLCTVERGFCVAASPRRDDTVHVVNALTGEYVTASLADDVPQAGHWSNYVDTVVRRMAR